VAADLQNQQWTRVLWRMNTAEQMAEFVILWDMVQQIRLSDATDSILWRWTGNGLYSSKSACNFKVPTAASTPMPYGRQQAKGNTSYFSGCWSRIEF
jgi:hypothetical protein